MVDENDNKTIGIEEAIEGTLVEKPVAIATRLTEIQETYGDNRPYNEEQVIQEALFFRQQSLESVLEFGKRLVWIKESADPGRFTKILKERFDMEYRAAARIMQACVKLSNVSDPTHLIEATKNKAKLFELMILDDAELDELGQGKTVAGIELSDIEKMTSTELRLALKKAKEETEAARRVSSQKDEKINKLDEEVAKLEIKAEKAKKGAEKLALDEDPKAAATKSCLLSLADVSGDMQASTTQLIQILNRANDEQLDQDFFKQMALAVSQLYAGLGELLHDLPEDVDPVDTKWFTDDAANKTE